MDGVGGKADIEPRPDFFSVFLLRVIIFSHFFQEGPGFVTRSRRVVTKVWSRMSIQAVP